MSIVRAIRASYSKWYTALVVYSHSAVTALRTVPVPLLRIAGVGVQTAAVIIRFVNAMRLIGSVLMTLLVMKIVCTVSVKQNVVSVMTVMMGCANTNATLMSAV